VVFEAGLFGNLAQQVRSNLEHQGRIGFLHLPTGGNSVRNNVDVSVDGKTGMAP
jgi:hypothetical protein